MSTANIHQPRAQHHLSRNRPCPLQRLSIKQYICTVNSCVATRTRGGERNNRRGWVVGYVQQLIRTDNKSTTARSASCQLISDTCLVVLHNIHTCYCCKSTTSHTKSEKICCYIARNILYSSRGDCLVVCYLLEEALQSYVLGSPTPRNLANFWVSE